MVDGLDSLCANAVPNSERPSPPVLAAAGSQGPPRANIFGNLAAPFSFLSHHLRVTYTSYHTSSPLSIDHTLRFAFSAQRKQSHRTDKPNHGRVSPPEVVYGGEALLEEKAEVEWRDSDASAGFQFHIHGTECQRVSR